jgi:hypothetical protein
MLAGEPPFTGPTVAAIVAKRISTPPPHVSTVRDIPPHVDVAVTRALARAGRSLRDRVGDGRRSRSTRVGFRVQGSRLEPPRGACGRTGRRSFRGRAGAAGPTCARWAAVSVSPRCWRAASAARPTEDLGAYDLYLKGRFAWNRRTGRSLTQAASWSDQAIARDSGFARAWAGVADTYILLPGYTGADQATSWRAQRRLPPEHSPSTRFCRRRSPRSPTGPGCRSRSICGEPRPGASPHRLPPTRLQATGQPRSASSTSSSVEPSGSLSGRSRSRRSMPRSETGIAEWTGCSAASSKGTTS